MQPRTGSFIPSIRRLAGALPDAALLERLRAALRETAGLVLLATSTAGYLWLLERVSSVLSAS